MTTPPWEAVVLVRRADEFLLVHRAADRYWHVVAGRIEPGEDAAVVKQDGSGVEVAYYAFDAPFGWEPVLNWEHDGYRWCTAEAARALLRWPEPARHLEQLTEGTATRP